MPSNGQSASTSQLQERVPSATTGRVERYPAHSDFWLRTTSDDYLPTVERLGTREDRRRQRSRSDGLPRGFPPPATPRAAFTRDFRLGIAFAF